MDKLKNRSNAPRQNHSAVTKGFGTIAARNTGVRGVTCKVSDVMNPFCITYSLYIGMVVITSYCLLHVVTISCLGKVMKKWSQRIVFVERVKEYCRKNGLLTKRGAVQMEVLADMFNLNEDVLRQFLQDSTRRRPHINTLTHIASVLGCSVTEFLDAPSDPPPGMSLERWAGLDERERVLVSSLLVDISTDDLTLAEKELLYKDFHQTKERMLKLKELWAASNLKHR
jgi:transcriptional regulator with XRE-family HTH domain